MKNSEKLNISCYLGLRKLTQNVTINYISIWLLSNRKHEFNYIMHN